MRYSSKSCKTLSLLGLLRPLCGSASPRATLAFARLSHGRGADSSAFLGRPCFATGYFRFAPIAHNLRTIQRDGRDAVGLRLPKPSAAVFRLSKLAEKLPRSVFRLRRASRPLGDLAPRSRGEAGRARVGSGRGAAMPRPLLDSVKNGRSFAASASRDRFASFGLAFGEVSLAPLPGHRFATRYRSGDTRSAHFPSPKLPAFELFVV